jgi:hypothetical protein
MAQGWIAPVVIYPLGTLCLKEIGEKMTLEEYIAKYRRSTAALTLAEAKIAGIAYPLPSGWFKKNRLREVDGEAMYAAMRARKADVKARRETNIAIFGVVPKEPKKARKAKRIVAKAMKTLGLTLVIAPPPPVPRAVRAPRPAASEWHAYVNSPEFLVSFEWRQLRLKAFEKYGRACLCCGATPGSGVVLNVDHVKSRRRFPDLALDLNNLQVLCEDCNHGKGNDDTDFRTS